jgi:hypothetical protein
VGRSTWYQLTRHLETAKCLIVTSVIERLLLAEEQGELPISARSSKIGGQRALNQRVAYRSTRYLATPIPPSPHRAIAAPAEAPRRRRASLTHVAGWSRSARRCPMRTGSGQATGCSGRAKPALPHRRLALAARCHPYDGPVGHRGDDAEQVARSVLKLLDTSGQASTYSTISLRRSGRASDGPSGVFPQSNSRMCAAIALPPCGHADTETPPRL